MQGVCAEKPAAPIGKGRGKGKGKGKEKGMAKEVAFIGKFFPFVSPDSQQVSKFLSEIELGR